MCDSSVYVRQQLHALPSGMFKLKVMIRERLEDLEQDGFSELCPFQQITTHCNMYCKSTCCSVRVRVLLGSCTKVALCFLSICWSVIR